MDTNIISGLTGSQIQNYLAEFNAAHGTDGVSAEFKVNDAGETLVVVTGKGGETRSIAVTDIPEIDPAEEIPGEEAAAALEKLADKLNELANELKADTQKSSPSMNVFCDIFALIHLLMEVAQQQQKTASAIRQQGHAAVQANLQAQADSIRAQAESAFGLGLASAIMSSVMTVSSLVMLGVGAHRQNKAAEKANMEGAEANLGDIKQQLSDVQDAANGQAKSANGMDPKTTKMLEELGYDTKNPEEARNQFMKDFMPETAKAEPEANAAKAKYLEAQKEADAAAGELKEAKQNFTDAETRYNNKKAQLDQAKTDAQKALEDFNKDSANDGIEVKYQELKGSITNETTAEQLVEATKGTDHSLTPEEAQKVLDCSAKHAAVDKANTDINDFATSQEATAYESAKTKLNDAQQKYQTLNQAANDAHAAWQVKAMELQQAQNADKNALEGRIDETNAKIDEANKKKPAVEKSQDHKSLKTAKKLMKQIEKAQDRDTTALVLEGLKNKLDGAREKMTAVANTMGVLEDARSAKNLEGMINICGQFSNSFSAFINTIKERNAGLAEAERKEIDAEIDKGRAMIEEADDLRQSAQKQINDFIQILSSIQQMQTQTNLQMIRG